jgi:hypothetical protein
MDVLRWQFILCPQQLTYINSTLWMRFECMVLTRNLHTTTKIQQKTYIGLLLQLPKQEMNNAKQKINAA